MLATNCEVSKQDAKALHAKTEKSVIKKYFIPRSDLVEQDKEFSLIVDLPGVKKENLKIDLKKDLLSIDGQIDRERFKGLKPVYSEYDIGHYTRKFKVSDKIDSNNIKAQFEDGVLTLTLPKSPEAMAKKIAVN